MTTPDSLLRAQLGRFLGWDEAHVGFEAALADVPLDKRGRRPAGTPHSLWELVEHIRLTQHDILSFCLEQDYVAPEWPREYWPPVTVPPSDAEWNASIAASRRDREALQRLVADGDVDLFARVPTGNAEQTYLRAVLLVADHTAHHLGQIVLVRRLLGIWPPS